MNGLERAARLTAVFAVVLCASAALAADEAAAPGSAEPLAAGDTVRLSGRQVTVARLDGLPYVDTTYSRRYTWDTYENPKLRELRTEYGLDKVIAPGRDEFEKQCLLMTWVHEQWKFGDPQSKGGMRNALEILRLAKKEDKFFCVQYAATLVSASASVGWVCRPCGKSNHSWTEMWSNQHCKWVFFDPTPNMYVEKDGVLLSTYEIRREWFADRGKSLVFVNPGTGTRSTGQRFNYNTITYIPNTNFLDARPEYGKAFIVFDEHSGGRKPSGRDVLENPTVDAHFPINQAAPTLVPDGRDLRVALRTLTPNFRAFQVRIDDADWAEADASFAWPLHEGRNRLRARSLNKWDLPGPVSTVEVVVRDTAALADGDGAIVVPAVSFVDQGGGRVGIREKGGQTTDPYVHLWYTPGHWLEWTADVPRAGDWRLALRYGSRFTPRRELRVNGRLVKGLEAFTLQRTGGWTAWAEKRLSETFRLKAGRNLIRLTCLDETSLCLQGMRLVGTEPGTPDVTIDPLRFTGQGGGEVQCTVSDERGYFFMWNDKGHAFEWTVDAPEAGPYDVFLWYASLKPTSRRMHVNGRAPEGLDAFPLEPTGDWRYWVEARLPAPVELRKGRNVLRMTNTAGTACNLSAIRLAGPGGKDILIDAVDYTKQTGGTVREVRRSRHGSFYMWNDEGHWLQWAVEAPRAGEYDVALRYATRARSPREVRVNGRVVEGLESVTLEPTGDWSAWREARLPARVNLVEGRNLLRMTSLGGGGLNLDEIRLTPAPPAAP